MFGLGFPELLIILVIILVIFGAGKLPQVGEALGKGINKFRGAVDEKKPEDAASSVPAKVDHKEASAVEEDVKSKDKVKS